MTITPPHTANTHSVSTLQQANQLLAQGDQEGAMALYLEAAKRMPKQAGVHDGLALLSVQRGRLVEAVDHLKTALEIDDTQPTRWLRLVDVLIRCNRPVEAKEYLSQVTQKGLRGQVVDTLSAAIEQALRTSNQGTAGMATQATQPPEAMSARQREPDHRFDDLLQTGNYDAAQQMLNSLTLDEQQLAVWRYRRACLAFALCRFDEAETLFQALNSELGEDPNFLNYYALTLKHQKRHEEAHRVFERLVEKLPLHVGVYTNIGANLNDARRFTEALVWLDRGLQIDPNYPPLRANKATTLVEQELFFEAKPILESLLAENYRSEVGLTAWGRVLLHNGFPEQALEMFEEAGGQTEGEDGVNSYYRARALNDLGRFEEAIAAATLALERDSNLIEAWAMIAHARKMTTADQVWQEKAETLVETAGHAEQIWTLHYALGKYYDDVKKFPPAFSHYRKANQLKKATWQETTYDPDHQERLVERLMQCYPTTVPLAEGDRASARPLFIVGMPRSGTSLTEQILSSHAAVHGAGELHFWSQSVLAAESAVLSGTLDASWLETTAQACLVNLENYNSDASRVVDKMPGNFHWVGVIHAVFPNARILHTMRNPLDTCLSIYFQNFNKGHKYANDLDDLAHYYRQYHRLMAHWRKTLPADRFLELPYEQLVEDQEGWSRKIIEFIGLPWDERCLEFYKTERKVGTASNWQAKQPIYKTSKERWRNYEQFIEPLWSLKDLYDPLRGQVDGR